MKKSSPKLLPYLAVMVALSIAAVTIIYGRSTGISGRTLKTTNAGCGNCHGASPSSNVQVAISGPNTLNVGQAGRYKVTVTHVAGNNGGVDIAVDSGTLTPVSSTLILKDNELVHNTPVTVPSTYEFDYTPSAPGAINLYATAKGTGEAWNAAPNKQITVAASNNPPVLSAITDQTVDEGKSLKVSVSASDADGDKINLVISNLPAFGQFTDNGNGTGTISLAPGFADAGVYAGIKVTATDARGLSDSKTFVLTVNDVPPAVNNPPALAGISNQTMAEGTKLNVPLSANDPDGDKITLTATNLPAFGVFVDNGDGTGTINFAPGFSDAGTFAGIQVRATDAGGLSNSKTFTLVVTDVTPSTNLTVNIDIKPAACPNQLSLKKKGALQLAILGTQNLDVNNIDPATVKLEGVPILSSKVEDVAAPVINSMESCACTTAGPDGNADLTLEFDAQAVVAALGNVMKGDQLTLTLTGNLNDGTSIIGQDCISIPGRPKLNKVPDQAMKKGKIQTVSVSAQLSVGETIKLTVSNLPSFGRFVDNGDGTGLITFAPKSSETGVSPNITVLAVSGGSPQLSDVAVFSVAVDGGTTTAVAEEATTTPNGYVLDQNYPNPFNPETQIRFHLPVTSHVVVKVFNTQGQEIRQLVDLQYETGSHTLTWDGRDNTGRPVASGVYFYQLRAGDFALVRKMNLLR